MNIKDIKPPEGEHWYCTCGAIMYRPGKCPACGKELRHVVPVTKPKQKKLSDFDIEKR